MNRRDFLWYTGTVSLLPAGTAAAADLLNPTANDYNTFNYLTDKLIALNDTRIEKLMEQQESDPDSENYGGVKDQWGICNPGSATGLVKSFSCAVFSEKSKYYQDERLFRSMEGAVRFLMRVQHSNGAIDLLTTNFRSAPDTGFVVEPLCACYQVLLRAGQNRSGVVTDLLKTFLLKAGEALVAGGIHTPNHRWVVSMALARLNWLFPDKRYIQRIGQWLNEGIDIDPDGQYEERSTYIYTPLTNRCLVTMARLLDKRELLEHVRKNLEMTLYYIHPNGEIATEASGRQDQFRVGNMEHYYIPLRFMAINDNNGQFAWLVREIERSVPEKLLTYLIYFLESPSLGKSLPQSSRLSDHYTKEFPHSGVVRLRRGNKDATILANNPTFFTFCKGEAVVPSVRLASAFFGRGQFISETVENEGGRFILKWRFEWGYFQPLPDRKKPDYSVPFDVDRKKRKMSGLQQLEAVITVEEKEGEMILDLHIAGTDNVPLAVEIACRKGGELSGARKSDLAEDTWLFQGEPVFYRKGKDNIKIDTGSSVHDWTSIRGGLPKPDAPCIYLTGYTPFKEKIRFS